MFSSTTFIVIGIPVICGTLIALAAILKNSDGKSKTKQASDEEAQLIQELHQGLNKMESRIEALETILIQKHTQQDKDT